MQVSFNLNGAAVTIERSPTHSDSCAEPVSNQLINSSSITVVDTLSCRYAGREVTYCLQLNVDDCQLRPSMQTIQGNS